MALHDPANLQRNREWRRHVRVKARIKAAEGWSDASILNVSSRGLMIRSSCCSDPGKEIELRSGDQAFRGRVVWRKGQRLGLRSDSVLPLMDIVSLSESLTLEGGDGAGTMPNRARARRSDSFAFAQWTRLLELGSTLVIGAAVVSGFLSVGAGEILGGLSAATEALRN